MGASSDGYPTLRKGEISKEQEKESMATGQSVNPHVCLKLAYVPRA